MSYTFSRRNFMKFTALTAAAVAFSGTLTGCSNPNQPSATYTGSDSTLSFNGSSNVWDFITSNRDKQTLKAGAAYEDGTLTCNFEHTAVTSGIFGCNADRYQITIYYNDKTAKAYKDGSACGDNTVKFTSDGGSESMDANVTYPVKLTVTGIDYTDAKKVVISYFPRYTALGNKDDSYNDVRASWDITSVITG